jgi:hypothetical protein
MTLPPNPSLEDARQWLRERAYKGADCPCCKQFAKVYRRKITSSMAYAAILIYRHFSNGATDEWLHVPSFLNSVGLKPRVAAAIRGDWAKLEHWGMLEPQPGVRDDGSTRTGYYRITPMGRAFVERRLRVKKYIYIYNGMALAKPVSDELVDIDEALGEKFSYQELMRG